ncbi:cysteinyl-tRNA(Pro) deacylase [Campylobacter blaseri]|uniref:Cys-tRNA(Pro)/Cys-tRNA(Cys) deacylase n=1 Tax=Campylobacter blaseri TaxID=2042961 RepID=A0A2P8R0J5_9BACT|nr:Cys-tRNA(Pro) deacylase [Campylobacter blaseri]PSM52017.1 Cys-tRNA(Pro) deacylase [Campylobacter blaseri]PSM53802.1 Cys-tRNA(Pro) deacylase [Campylobacter blaseri]QKF85646.1 cysteinyl-tRNA(Pro) deacylase [Campylobacter blaseri]
MEKYKTNAMRILDKHKAHYEAFFYESDGAIDGISVAKKIGFDVDMVYKTLVLKGNDNNYYVAVIPVAKELDLKKMAKVCEVKKVELIPVAKINAVTGYVRGGCSPFGMKKDYPIQLDKSAQSLDEIIVSGGKIGVQIKLKVKDIVQIRNAKFADLLKV